MKTLNMKNLIPDMTLQEKARLLFSHEVVSQISRGKTRFLDPKEEKLIIEDCSAKRQLGELNKLYRLHHASQMAVIEISHATTCLELWTSRISGFSATLIMKSRGYDAATEALAFLRSQNKDIAEKLEQLPHMKEVLDHPTGILEAVDHLKDTYIPNKVLQNAFVQALASYKHLMLGFLVVEMIEEEGGMSFLGVSDREQLQEAKVQMQEFEEFQGNLAVMNVFHAFYEQGLMNGVVFESDVFKTLLLNPELAFELTDREKEYAKEIVSWHASE